MEPALKKEAWSLMRGCIISSVDAPQKLKCCHSCQKVLRKLCGIGPCARKMILRFLLEGAVSPDHAPSFGSKVDDPGLTSQGRLQPMKPCLSESNRRQGSRFSLSRGHSTVFYAGIIGQGLKPPPRLSPFSKVRVTVKHIAVPLR